MIPQKTAFDTLAKFLKTKLAYKDGERDLVLLRHEIGIEWPEKKQVGPYNRPFLTRRFRKEGTHHHSLTFL